MSKIATKCNACGNICELPRTNEIPEDVKHLTFNWCPLCEDENANGPFEEEYQYTELPQPPDPNQLNLF